jgi:DNA-binding transcriptional ArsR family regulator
MPFGIISRWAERKIIMKKTEVECCDVTYVHDDRVLRARRNMPKEELIKELADFYKVFADGTRVKILCVLLESEMCVCDLAEVLEMTQSAISHQLRVLKQMKLVKNRREGKTVYYSLADDHIQTIISQGMEHITE